MRYFITSDVHSCFKELSDALYEAGFDYEKDTFVSLGDNFDRGDGSYEMYKFLKHLPHKILIRGNHEDLLDEVVNKGYFAGYDFSNGTYKTIIDIIQHDYPGFREDNTSYIIQFFTETEFYDWFSKEEWLDKFELGNYILTHASCAIEDNKVDWKRARWEAPYLSYIPKDKTLICGHFFSWLGKCYFENVDRNYYYIKNRDKLYYKPFKHKNLIMIDACTPTTHKVNILVIDDKDLKVRYNRRVLKDTKLKIE